MTDLEPAIADVRQRSGERSVSLDADARAAAAARFGWESLDSLDADVVLDVGAGEVVTLTGEVRAALVQRCAATGEPLPVNVREPVALRFVPTALLEAEESEAEVELDADALDTVGYDGGRLPLGDALVETVALALDPFPRAPNADAILRERGVLSEEEAARKGGAFSGLSSMLAPPPARDE